MSYKHFDFQKGVDVLGDEELFKMMLQRYRDELKTKAQGMRDAYKANDSKELRKVAHALKGSSGYVAAETLKDSCERIQKTIDTNGDDAPGIKAAFEEFDGIAIEAEKELDKIFA
eukprot:GDKH01017989.1.p1 GENE.GDKH01017989.1~~GDKH01017989.1.p1  ORF type:complete len:115 (-),score=18.15 GDKH01017989.1:341-685(-)